MDENQTFDQDRIIKINIEEEMKSSYIDYSMSVIVARALPDVRDGFKPVHRRILYGMKGINNVSSQPYKKCARVVGEVLGKYHPHGDSSVYGALVRMGQEWNMRYTLGSVSESSKLFTMSTVSFSMSSIICSPILERRHSVYLMAAGESPSTDPKFPCPSTSV